MTDLNETSRTAFVRGQHAIVTGGGHGIGRTIAARLARDGFNVTMMGRDATRLDNTVRDLKASFSDDAQIDVQAVVCDVADPESVALAFSAAADALGEAHILVNNAGVARSISFVETSLEVWRRALDVNLTGPFLCIQQVLPSMLGAGSGRIVNIASTAALRGFATLAAYSASKHGLLGMTRSLAAEVAHNGITVNAICPGYVEGGMSDQAIQSLMIQRNMSAEEALAMLVCNSPHKRLTTQDEVAATVSRLCSVGASAITGQAITVMTGETM